MKSKKQIIVEEAAVLFRDKGYSAASMRDLAERVGLKPSSFYNHIKSKEEILQKLCFDSAQKFTAGIKEVEATSLSNTEKLQMLIRLHIKVALEDPSSVTVFNDEWKHLSEPYLTQFLDMRRDYESRFLQIIKKGIAAGELQPLDPAVILYTFINALRWLHFGTKSSRDLSPNQIEEHLIQILLKGLSTSPKN